MISVGSWFSKFLSNIQLTQAQLEDGIIKHHGVRRTLHQAYYSSAYNKAASQEQVEFSGYITEYSSSYSEYRVPLDDKYVYQSSILIGSYGKRTAIAPPSDIDILFQIPREQFERYNSYTSNGQSQLLQDVKVVLQRTYPNTKIRADGPVVSVPFTSYKVEVLPAFKLLDGGYMYPVTKDGGSWSYTNPKAELSFISASNKRSNGNTVRLIKMMKAWKQFCQVPISSLVIELSVVDFLQAWTYYDKGPLYYDFMVRDYLAELINRANYSHSIPGINEVKKYGDKWKPKAELAVRNSIDAIKYEVDDLPYLATIEWRKIFGPRFEYPD